MTYAETLRKLVDTSGLSLREIAFQARSKYNVPFDASYISKIQSGKHAPPSDEISKAIALVCGGDPDELVFQAYIDNAPAVVKGFIDAVEFFMKSLFDHMAGKNMPPELLANAQRELDTFTPYTLLQKMTAMLRLETDPSSGVAYMPAPDGNRAIAQIAAPSMDIDPLMPDDSMEPLIPKGASLRVQEEAEYLDGDIVLLGSEIGTTVRRIMRTEGHIVLLPLNPKYKPVSVNEVDVRFFGLVKSVAHAIARS